MHEDNDLGRLCHCVCVRVCRLPVFVHDGVECQAVSPAGGEVVHVDIRVPAAQTAQYSVLLTVCY